MGILKPKCNFMQTYQLLRFNGNQSDFFFLLKFGLFSIFQIHMIICITAFIGPTHFKP